MRPLLQVCATPGQSIAERLSHSQAVLKDFMFFRRADPIDMLPQFAALPITQVCPCAAARPLAVHVAGDLSVPRAPLVCIPGYVRNMLDFAALARGIAADRPVVLIDLAGRGRSAALPREIAYSTLTDAEDVLSTLTALGIERAVFLGQGHGGQVAMLVARRRPSVLGGTILLDAGPVIDSRGLVRMRNNLRYILSLKTEKAARDALRRILLADYPGETEDRIAELAGRLFHFDRSGRPKGFFDLRLLEQIEKFDFDDVLEPQWPLFDALTHAPLMLARTQLTDQVRRATFDEMMRRRPDAATLILSGEGSPALLEGAAERDAIAAFASEADPRDEDTTES